MELPLLEAAAACAPSSVDELLTCGLLIAEADAYCDEHDITSYAARLGLAPAATPARSPGSGVP